MTTDSDTRQAISQALRKALRQAQNDGVLPPITPPELTVVRPQNQEHGDYSCNVAMRLAGAMRMSPLEIAQQIQARIEHASPTESVEVAPPGFLNIRLSPAWKREQLRTVIAVGDQWGRVSLGGGKRVQVEFVSANPTGPLQLGNARGAVLGDVLASVLDAAGFDVQREYYINDTGEQIRLFGLTLFARYHQHFYREMELPEGAYQGEYMKDIASDMARLFGEKWLDNSAGLPEEFVRRGLGLMIDQIRKDLLDLNIDYDHWQSETALYRPFDTNRDTVSSFEAAMTLLRDGGYTVEKEGAEWFRTAAFGGEQDEVLIRSNGKPTYFASDVAYHYNKFIERRFDIVIDVWGADHHGHVARTKSAVDAIGANGESLEVVLYQLVHLRRGRERVRISKRTGELVTLRELVDEVGADAVRFFLLQRSADAQMDFDLEAAVSQDMSQNPASYVQYAHVRCASVIRAAKDKDLKASQEHLELLEKEVETTLVDMVLKLPEVVADMASRREPHHLANYAFELASAFAGFYTQCKIVDEDDVEMTGARLTLVEATKAALSGALRLMGIKARNSMHFLRKTGETPPLLVQHSAVGLRGAVVDSEGRYERERELSWRKEESPDSQSRDEEPT
ncbi:MAG: arginine--tRNA ligase [Chloroflexi bacterium]|nr:arginine--tRNA ligase [Chloroflexota bacterium]